MAYESIQDSGMPSVLPVDPNLMAMAATFDDPTSANALIGFYANVAVQTIEKYCGRPLISRQFTWTLSTDATDVTALGISTFFGTVGNPSSWGYGQVASRWLSLPYPTNNVASVVFNLTDGTQYVANAQTDYRVDTQSWVGRLRVINWPAITANGTVANMQVQFTSGYGANAASVPMQLQQAVFLVFTRLVYNKGDGSFELIDPAVASLCAPYRDERFGGQSLSWG